MKKFDESWVDACGGVLGNEDGSVDAVKGPRDVGQEDGGFEVVVRGENPVEKAESDEVAAGVAGAEGPLAEAIGVGLVEVRKEEEADAAFDDLGKNGS